MARTSKFKINIKNKELVESFVNQLEKQKSIPIVVVEENKPTNYFIKADGFIDSEYIDINFGCCFQYGKHKNVEYILIQNNNPFFGSRSTYYFLKGYDFFVKEYEKEPSFFDRCKSYFDEVKTIIKESLLNEYK